MKYDIKKHGVVTAIRIFEEMGEMFPKAELFFALTKETITITWTNKEEREEYLSGINGYTIIYDERSKNIPLEHFKK